MIASARREAYLGRGLEPCQSLGCVRVHVLRGAVETRHAFRIEGHDQRFASHPAHHLDGLGPALLQGGNKINLSE